MGGRWYKNRDKLIEYKGEKKTLSEWSKEVGIQASTLYLRLYKLGWDIERAFTTAIRKTEDLTGRRFGRLVVKGIAPKKSYSRHIQYYCQCDCGMTSVVASYSLRAGTTTSCGCKVRKHGHTGQYQDGWASPEYRSWDNMMKRCYNPKDKGYHNYGGRGIKVCEEWHDFKNFYKDMGPRPEGCTLDRKDSNKDYKGINCRWATRSEQDRNRRTNTWLSDSHGTSMIITDWAAKLGVGIGWIQRRLDKGYTMDEIIAFARYK